MVQTAQGRRFPLRIAGGAVGRSPVGGASRCEVMNAKAALCLDAGAALAQAVIPRKGFRGHPWKQSFRLPRLHPGCEHPGTCNLRVGGGGRAPRGSAAWPPVHMARPGLRRGPGAAALTALATVLSAAVAAPLARDTRPCFLEQLKAECHFSNGTERVWTVTRFIYNQEEFAHFDSDIGNFQAVTELGRPIAEDLNRQKDVLDSYRASVDRCRNNYQLVDILMLKMTVQPRVTVHPAKTQPAQHHNLLVCSVDGFYPGAIEVSWFLNGHEETAGVVSTGLIRNGDWTFQTLVMLETVPQRGEVYTCRVQHPSLPNPVSVEWRAQSGSAQSKMLSGVGGIVLGLLFLGAGLFIHCRSPKGHPGVPPTGLLS
uniref:H-2 class II histocompatibility antigen, E-S beta chain-like n=1 Tax=Jaculus jaculus TaxID=51337 RepID=UPI001E1B2224|nr:H-2 class II histocompatibility antigen, E-S beta chain-like [Jaculus jaculus]